MSDWTTDAADAIERAVVTVRDKTVTPARTVTRGIVFGVLAALFVLPALVILVAGAFRGLVELYQGEVLQTHCSVSLSWKQNWPLNGCGISASEKPGLTRNDFVPIEPLNEMLTGLMDQALDVDQSVIFAFAVHAEPVLCVSVH